MMRRILVAAVAYFSVVFSVAFLLGVIRTIWIAPRLGEVAGVLIEGPILVWISWVVAGRCINRFSIPARALQRLSMGLVAFLLLMAAETALGTLVFFRPLSQQLTTYATPAGAIGLLAQVAFGLVPFLRTRGR